MTRQLIVTEMLTLDGIMEAPGGGDHPHAGWTFQGIDVLPEAYAIKGREQEEAEALLLGRRTFEEFAPVWPDMDDEFARYNRMPKFVVSTSLSAADVESQRWQNCHLLTSLEEVRALKADDGGPILVHGSGQLAQSLLEAGLVDRYHLLTFPVLLGAGKRLFTADAPAKHSLRLVEQESYANGVQMSVWDVVAEERG